MKNLLSFALLLVTGATSLYAQNTFPSTGSAGIGTTTPAASAALEIKSTNQGLLIPRMSKSQRDLIGSPVAGLMIYQNDNTPGFYYYSGSAWTPVSVKGANTKLSNLVAPTAVNQDLLPAATATYSLGSTTQRWSNLYLGNLNFPDGTGQSTAFTPYTAGNGISITGTTISSTVTSSQWTTVGRTFDIYHNGGNVGIGTTTPSSKLHVVSTTANTAIFDGPSGMNVRLYDNGIYRGYFGTSSGAISTNDVEFGTGAGNTSGSINFTIQGVSKMTLHNTGNVGIGTLLPTAKLHLKHNSSVSNPQLLLYENENDYARLNFQNTSTSNFFAIAALPSPTTSAAKLNFYYQATGDIMTLQGDGKVGIGTATPATKLHVVDIQANVANFDGGNQMFIGLYEKGVYKGYIGSYSGNVDDVDFGTGGTNTTGNVNITIKAQPKMTITAAGNVGIGTTNPQYALSVNGTIQAKEIRVETGWADYVFEKNYKLRPIEELEQYINTNKHLPGVATANEVENKGLKVGEMNKAMMEKIEELTLYIIQLSKENKALRNEIDALKQ